MTDPSNTNSDEVKAAVIARALDAMWTRFLPDIRERVRLLEMAAQAASNGPLNGEACAGAQSAAHKLAGSLGTFGLDRGTALARKLDAIYAQGGIGPEQAIELAEAARELRMIVSSRR
jgi:HPt (histidine-containing phosphotransfer) domain-containing protein